MSLSNRPSTTETINALAGTTGGIAEMSDLEALALYAQKGDPRGFEVLAHRYRDMVLGTCLRAARNMADAEDATQETFLKLARHAASVQSNAAAWLHATAIRTTLDLLRKRAARQRVVDTARTMATSEGASEDERTWADIEPMVDAALGKLSDAERSLIIERFLAGRSQADLAREAGVNAGTISRRIDAALEHLRTHLREAGVGAGGAGTGVVGVAAVGLAGALGVGAQAAQASPALCATLGKIGLSEIGQLGASTAGATSAGSGAALATGSGGVLAKVGAGWIAAAIGVLCVGTVGVVGVSRYVGASGAAGVAAVGSTAAVTGAMARPSKATAPARSVSIAGDDTLPYMFFNRDSAQMLHLPRVAGGPNVNTVTMDIVQCEPSTDVANNAKAGGTMKLKVRAVTMDKDTQTNMTVGSEQQGRWSISADGQIMAVFFVDPKEPDKELGMALASRAPKTLLNAMKLPEPSAEGNHPELAGLWQLANELAIVIDNDNI
ncbi:MAG: sigma-70 family RNA polymerase sigma factor [Phycisphaerales bacterium]|nr:sigma-70 family RNA polymerase sigma factor [Phycisphaerales bacterium]